jgi:hypothetical protein
MCNTVLIIGRLCPSTGSSLHAAHPGRKFRVLDVQFDIYRKLAGVASGAQVVGTGDKMGLQRISWYRA